MALSKQNNQPAWIRNLRALMEQKNFNPRSLSLKAGLNATAVRDMLEGRSRFPRYDTACALAEALGVTPAILMNDPRAVNTKGEHDLELLTEVIARLQEAVEAMEETDPDHYKKLSPREFAAMASTIYSRAQLVDDNKKKLPSVRSHVVDLLDYETLRHKRGK